MEETTARAIFALLTEEGLDCHQSLHPRRIVVDLNENDGDENGIITILLLADRITMYTNRPVRKWSFSLGDPEVFSKVVRAVDEVKERVRLATWWSKGDGDERTDDQERHDP